MNIDTIIQEISIWAIPILLAIVLHEVAHGWVAYKLGDDTAYWLGRLTLNPIKHIDPIGTILIPVALLVIGSPFLFAYAKPVPINFRKLRNPARDMLWVALAGPITNLLLALISVVVLYIAVHLLSSFTWLADPLALMCKASILINMVLCIFNLIPLPPLDGGRVAVALLPGPLSYQLSRIEPFGFMIIVLLLATGFLQTFIGPLVMGSTNGLMNLVL